MMDMHGMGSMMVWMMGFGLLGWVLVIGILVAIVALLWRLVNRADHDRGIGRRGPDSPTSPHR